MAHSAPLASHRVPRPDDAAADALLPGRPSRTWWPGQRVNRPPRPPRLATGSQAPASRDWIGTHAAQAGAGVFIFCCHTRPVLAGQGPPSPDRPG